MILNKSQLMLLGLILFSLAFHAKIFGQEVRTEIDVIKVLSDSIWVSDKEATRNWIKNKRPNSDLGIKYEKIDVCEAKFSNEGDFLLSQAGNILARKSIEVLGVVNYECALKVTDPHSHVSMIVILTFEKDLKSYWLYDPLIDFSEKWMKGSAPIGAPRLDSSVKHSDK